MKTCFRIERVIAVLFFCYASETVYGPRSVYAADEQPPGPDRFTIVTEDYTSYEWWLTSYTDNQVACSINVDHEGLPGRSEIYNACEKTYYDQWSATKICLPGKTCSGYYLQFVDFEPAQRQVGVELPPAEVWVSLNGCVPYNSTFRCDALPTLVLTGEEPLEGEHISSLGGRVDGTPFSCDPICQVDLVPTENEGQNLEFWAYSSYGDSSKLFQARCASWLLIIRRSMHGMWMCCPPSGGDHRWRAARKRGMHFHLWAGFLFGSPPRRKRGKWQQISPMSIWQRI